MKADGYGYAVDILKVLSYWNLNAGFKCDLASVPRLKVLSYWNLNAANAIQHHCSQVT